MEDGFLPCQLCLKGNMRHLYLLEKTTWYMIPLEFSYNSYDFFFPLGKKDCSLAAMAYDTLIPKAFLEVKCLQLIKI